MLRAPRSGISLIVDLAKRSADELSMEGKDLYPFIKIANRTFKDRNVTVGNTNFSFDKDGVAKVFLKGSTVKEDIQKAIDFHGFYFVEEKVLEPVAITTKVVDNAIEVPIVKEVIEPTPVAEEKLPESSVDSDVEDEPIIMIDGGEEIPLETPKSKKRKSKKE